MLDRASGPIKGITRNVKGLRLEAERAGSALDNIAGPKELAELKAFSSETRGLASAFGDVKTEVRQANPSFLAYNQRLRSAQRETVKLTRATDALAVSLRGVGAIDARPTVALEGLAESRAELAALRRELRAFSRSHPTATVGVRRGGTGVVGGGGAGGRVARSGAYAGFPAGAGVFTTRTGLVGGSALAALPVGQALGGAAIGIGGSAYGAALGAGGLGVAGIGTMAAGAGALASVLGPAVAGLKELTKQQKAYTDAVADYGRKSKEAARARWELAQAEAAAPAGGAALLRQQRGLSRDWTRMTRPGQGALLGAGAGALRDVRRAAPALAGSANLVSRSAGRQTRQFSQFATSPQQVAMLGTFAREFAGDLKYAENTAEHLVTVFGNVGKASLPLFHEGAKFVDRWTGGLAQSTSDVGALRHEMRGYVDDLKAWGHLTSSAFELAHDVLMGGRPAGRSALKDISKTLDRWDSWVERNPDRIESFFRTAASDAGDLADSAVDVANAMNSIATELRPLLGPLTTFASLTSSVAGATSPGVAGAAFLGYRALRNNAIRGGSGTGGGAGAGAGAGVPLVMAAGGAAAGMAGGRRLTSGQYLRARAARLSPSAVTRATAGDVLTARGYTTGAAAAGRAAGTAGRYALPGLVLGGASGLLARGANEGHGFIGTTAHGIVNTAQGVGAMFGLANPVLGTDQRTAAGQARAAGFIGGLPGGTMPTSSEAADAARRLAPELSRAEQSAADAAFKGGKNRNAEAMAYLQALRLQADAYKDIAKQARLARKEERHALEVDANARSREHAGQLIGSFGVAHDRFTERFGADQGMQKTVEGVFGKMKGMRPTGARMLGENVLQWAGAEAKKNPELADSVDWLTDHIERSFSNMRDRVRVINGKILTDSSTQWNSIGRAIVDPANQALSETSGAFKKLRAEALGQLTLMGYSESEARALFKGVRSGKVSPTAPGVKTGSGQPLMQSDANLTAAHGYSNPITGKKGDGIGDDLASRGARAGGRASGSSSSLLGADSDFAPYAQLGAEFGASVSSGLRAGAITTSGNPSFHGSGDALDLAGGNMLGLAQALASQYGSGLEELIYSPLGWGIKDGKRVPLSVFGDDVIRDHYDHVHVADVDPRGPGGLSMPFSPDTSGPGLVSLSLTAPGSSLGGLPGALSDAATGAFASALMAKLGAGPLAGMTGPGAASAGGKFDKAALTSLWVQAGGDPSVANMAAAIALAESAGNPNARNSIGATGLWQIYNGPGTDPGLVDPMRNAQAAVAKWRAARGFTPWTTYTGADTPGHAKTYLRHMGDGLGRLRGRLQLDGGTRAAASAGPSVVNFSAQVHVGGGLDKAALRTEFAKFADQVYDEIKSGAEKRPRAMA